jgi:RNA polymerase sigma factor (sigma-70 family)
MLNEQSFKVELTKVYEENFDLWVKRLSRFVGESLAEDAVQEGFCRSLKYWRAFVKGGYEMAGWCWVIVLNAAKDINTSERTGQSYSLHEPIGTGEEKLTLEEVIGKPDEYDSEEFSSIVIGEIANDRLSKTSQDILWLSYIIGYTPREIVRILDVDNKAVRNCTHQFRNYIKEKYGTFR